MASTKIHFSDYHRFPALCAKCGAGATRATEDGRNGRGGIERFILVREGVPVEGGSVDTGGR
jgi:hypothetical protein